jgi:hypothetical protein
MKVLGIIGAGQLGSRHLQAIAKTAGSAIVYVVDVNSQSLEAAKNRFEEVNGHKSKSIHYIYTVDELPDFLDIVIVATNSLNRRTVIEALLANRKVKHLILEKFLFPRISDFDAVERIFLNSEMKIWVNCPRRAIDFYKEIINEIDGPVHFSVAGGNWGLACNSIHFLDLFARISNAGNLYAANVDLNNTLLSSKREGYIEFNGSLYIKTERGDSFEAISYESGQRPLLIRISTATAEWTINETSCECTFVAAKNKWQKISQHFVIPMQSEMGAGIITNLLETGECDLTPYEDSQRYHKVLLRIFIEHYNYISKTNIDLCPIT